MHACIHTYICAYIHTSVHTYICTYVHTCIHTCIHTYIHLNIRTYLHTDRHAACMHACMHTYILTYIHTYTPTHTHKLHKYMQTSIQRNTTPYRKHESNTVQCMHGCMHACRRYTTLHYNEMQCNYNVIRYNIQYQYSAIQSNTI